MKTRPLSLALSSKGHLYLYSDAANQENVPNHLADQLQADFAKDDAVGLLRLGLTPPASLPQSVVFWKEFAQNFIAAICKQPNDLSDLAFPENDITTLAPFMRGSEYLNDDMLRLIWKRLTQALAKELAQFNGSVEHYFATHHAAWNTVGRVYFHLAENKKESQLPFAFLASYTTRLSKTAQTQHLPLGRALKAYAGKQLLALLLPVQRAAKQSAFLKNLVDTQALFQPLAWQSSEAYHFLKEIPLYEAAGIIIRVPNWWQVKNPPRPRISISVGDKHASQLGLDALLDFNMQFALPSGEPLTQEEFEQLLSSQEPLIQIKGQWVHLDSEKLNQVLAHWKAIEKGVQQEGLSFAEGLRLLSGIHQSTEDLSDEDVGAWSNVVEGDWLQKTLAKLKHPDGEKALNEVLRKYLNTSLRPYQVRGVLWLWWLYHMRLGGCLADDMGLGKTIQVLALCLWIKYHKNTPKRAHLLIIPTSLLGNWQEEINRFAPSLSVYVAHRSVNQQSDLPPAKVDLVMTTYAMVTRLVWLQERSWEMVILDEAQAIKNPATQQARMIKKLDSQVRFVLTGTPIENHLLDLWSLFDFFAPGLLSSRKTFAAYSKASAGAEKTERKHFYTSVRRLINPYILRRLKSDKSIISDLPDKTEMKAYCTLTKEQAGFYQQVVNALAKKLSEVEGMQRRGLVLSHLMQLKHICNHPHQWLGHGEYPNTLSGKFIRLQELCEVIREKQEKVLIFTQFREIMPALNHFLSQIFQQEGLYLHGQTPTKARAKRVAAFQHEQGPPFFVLSLKAGGSGLNLTEASHVIHFDRWWNPAVENQATDRAYRIGQKKNVLVHKFICRGTIEEKIDQLIHSKTQLSDALTGQTTEVNLTELSDAQLVDMVSLDIHHALGENAS